jgi:hypothetical protein
MTYTTGPARNPCEGCTNNQWPDPPEDWTIHPKWPEWTEYPNDYKSVTSNTITISTDEKDDWVIIDPEFQDVEEVYIY